MMMMMMISQVALPVLVATASAGAAQPAAAASASVSSNVPGFDPWAKCRSTVKPIEYYHGALVGINMMRGLLTRAWSLPGGGGWIVAKGFSDAYSCNDCQ